MPKDYVSKPCKTCPFRADVKPFLHPARAEEIVYAASNPFAYFTCHNTFEYDGEEDHQGRETADFSRSKCCAGFLTLRAQEGLDYPEGFEPSWYMCYTNIYEMIEAYEQEYKNEI